MSFRNVPGREIEWINTGIERGFSNFLFIDSRYKSNTVLRRIFSLARKHGYRSLLIDEIPENDSPLLVEENVALRVRRPDFVDSTVHRFSFFRCEAGHTLNQEDFIGYAVFKMDSFKSPEKSVDHVFESVMPSPRDSNQNNFIACGRNYTVSTSRGSFSTRGVLYAQQNRWTFVCAHVALRSALACLLPESDITYARMNALVGIDHQKRCVGEGRGLAPDDIEKILAAVGIPFEKSIHEPNLKLAPPGDYQRDLYGFIESGCPALLGFESMKKPDETEGSRHIVPVFGHTFNDDTWVADAQRTYFGGKLGYFPSENWLSAYVIHDDNFGPYFCIPRHFLRQDNFRVLFGLKRVVTHFSAVEAEAVALDYFRHLSSRCPNLDITWYDRFAVYANCGWLVLRTLLVSRDEYLAHLQSLSSWDGTTLESGIQDHVKQQLPEYVWLVEASAPELFSASRRKFGEVLLRTDAPRGGKMDLSLPVLARLPGVILLRRDKEIVSEATSLQGHTDLYRHSGICREGKAE